MPGSWWDVKHEAYHADRTRDSHSSLELFRRSVPLYHAVRTGQIERDPTEEMALGTAFHLLLLEPDRWDAEVAVAPKVDRRTKLGKAAWQEFAEGAAGKLVVDVEDYDRLRKMEAAARRDPRARWLLDQPGRTEAACRWDDGPTGLPLKTLFDRILDCDIVLDAKSAADPTEEAWTAAAFRLGYHRQAALYLDAAWEVAGMEAGFVFLVVGKAPPFEVGLYEPDGLALDLGRDDNRRTLDELAARRAAGDWASRTHGRIVTFTAPRWLQPKL